MTLPAASLCLLSPHAARESAQLLHGEDQEEKQLEVMCQLANETHLHLKQPQGKTMTGVWQKPKQMSVVLKFYSSVTKTVISNTAHALLFPSVFTHHSQDWSQGQNWLHIVCPMGRDFGFHCLQWNCSKRHALIYLKYSCQVMLWEPTYMTDWLECVWQIKNSWLHTCRGDHAK